MSLTTALLSFPPAQVLTAHGPVQYRRAHAASTTRGITHVLLHGIGSASASWLAQLQQASQHAAPASHIVAWDAPGYGDTLPLPADQPSAADYAARMWAWLDALMAEAAQPFTLVGHSLGALMAASAAVARPERIARLVLLSPAGGYGKADPVVREKKLADRLANLAQLGPAGMASKRASAMLSSTASADQIAYVEQVMAAIRPDGYTQAARMLSNADLASDLQRVQCHVTIASGSADTVTPQAACQAMALAAGATYIDLGAVGHSSALEAGDAVNRLLGLAGEIA